MRLSETEIIGKFYFGKYHSGNFSLFRDAFGIPFFQLDSQGKIICVSNATDGSSGQRCSFALDVERRFDQTHPQFSEYWDHVRISLIPKSKKTAS